jgi:hypothetical protein
MSAHHATEAKRGAASFARQSAQRYADVSTPDIPTLKPIV